VVAQDAARVKELWANPDRVAVSDLVWLEELVAAYPAAVPLWWLYVRAVQRAESPKFAQVLQRCAAISPDRSALMNWVEEPLIPRSKVAKPERKIAQPEPKVAKPEPKAEVAKSLPKAEVPQSAPALPKEIDLDSLPEKVRAQILRSRAIMAKIKGDQSPTAAAPTHAPATNTASEPHAAVFVESDPREIPILAEPIAKQDAPPKPAAKAKQEVVPKPTLATEAIPSAAEGLSPFAQFVTRLSMQLQGPRPRILLTSF